MTRIAILMPYYNHPVGLVKTLESLRGESEEFTLVLVDDGNVPAFHVDAQAYDFPFKILRLEKNGGIVAALNAGLKCILNETNAPYELIARLDAGDEWIPGRLRAQRDFLIANPDHAWVGCFAVAINANGAELFTLHCPQDDAGIRKFMPINSAVCHPAVMIRVDAVRKAGFYSADFPAAEDYEFFWRLLGVGKGANLPQVWLRYEVDEAAPSISMRRRARQLQSRLKIQCQFFKFNQPLAWWGVLRTLLLMIFPYRVLRKLKSIFWQG